MADKPKESKQSLVKLVNSLKAVAKAPPKDKPKGTVVDAEGRRITLGEEAKKRH